ncbi:MAG: RlmE family RNA methyltransferase [Bacteroidia bacterium]|nr:RlmE family RNA methyltransferase [Bacteroidia bacterium]MDW8157287.1 RlmE family RNA methyltransferase [Bacteroidia bacterium]
MSYKPHDFYFKKAKSENYLARSVYKLKEINERFKIFRKGQRVLDLGAAPGSWSQYAAQEVGNSGYVLGIDLKPINLQLPNAQFVQADIFSPGLENICLKFSIPSSFDVVISDMAPQTTGMTLTDHVRSVELCYRALQLAQGSLKKGGTFVCKMLDGEDFNEFRDSLRPNFEKVQILRPKSTRKESKELFFIALGYLQTTSNHF